MDELTHAIERIYRERYVGFRNALATVTGSQGSARDAVQEGFARALRDRASFRGEGRLEAWVFRIALRTALETRRNGREVAFEDAVDPVLPEPELDPALASALRELPPRRPTGRVLRYFADLSYAEIAFVCGISEGTVAAALAQARASLLEQLDDRGEDMTDGSDRLLAARFAALASPLDDSVWLEVSRWAGLRPRRRRPWMALPLAAALAAILVGSALALYRGSIDFWSAEPAPERIVVDFHKMRALDNALGAGRLGSGLIPEETRKVTTFEIDGEPRGLFVAPTDGGGYCWRLHFISSCGRTGGDGPSFGAGWLDSESGGPQWVNGDFLDPEIRRFQIEYEDGTVAPVPFVWVTEPIDAGFFSFDVPPEHLAAGHRVTLIRAFDDDGRELARQTFPFSDPRWEDAPDGLPRVADRTQKRTLFDLRDHKGNPWTIVVAPAPDEKLCYAYNFGGGCFSPRFPATPDALNLKGGGVVSVCCAVGDGVATVELRYEDGTRTELEPVEGFLLGLVPPEQYAPGHRLERILMLDDERREVASRALQPDRRGVYPCAKNEEIDLGHGVTMCP